MNMENIDYTQLTFTADTYNDIDDITKGELMERLEKDFPSPIVNFMNMELDYTGRAKIMLNIANWLGLELDNEQFMFVMVETTRLLCEAGAGSGKTTVSQLRLIKEKLFYGKKNHEILALAYNGHAAEDMECRHSQMVEKINAKKVFNLNEGIMARTFHSLALSWIKEFPDEFGIKYESSAPLTRKDGSQYYEKDNNEWLLNGAQLQQGMQMAFMFAKKHFGLEEDIHKTNIYKVTAFNAYIQETLTAKDEWINLPQIKEFRFPRISQDFYQKNPDLEGIDRDSEKVLIVESIIKAFENYKKMQKRLEFNDVIYRFTMKLKEDESFRQRLHRAYPVILVDEYQDFTPLMVTALQLLAGSGSKLIVIGDGDQSIYGFRGTDSFNCLKFKSLYSEDLFSMEHNAVVTTIGTNRRCAEEIVLTAKRVIESNTLRYDKEIKPFHKGGKVKNEIFQTSLEQALYIAEQLTGKDMADLNESCIAYRNRESSMVLTRVLFEKNIPFVISSGFKPYEDRLTTGLMDVLYLLLYPMNKERQRTNLWKVLPTIKASDVKYIVGEGNENDKYFWELDFGQFTNNRGFVQTLTTLQNLSERVRNSLPLTEYFETLYNIYCDYYWDYQRKTQTFPNELEQQVFNYFCQPISFAKLVDDFTEKRNRLDRMAKLENGVKLSTFHGLKGLEYDRMFLVDLEDSIFPGLKREEESGKTEEQLKILYEESVKLLYVAITRARHELTMLWDANNPSQFQKLVMCKKEVTDAHIQKVLGSSVLTVNSNTNTTTQTTEQEPLTEPAKSDEELIEELKELADDITTLVDELEELDKLEDLDSLTKLEELDELDSLTKAVEELDSLPELDSLTETVEELDSLTEAVEELEQIPTKQNKPTFEDLTIEEPKQVSQSVNTEKTYELKPKGSQLNNILKGIRKLS